MFIVTCGGLLFPVTGSRYYVRQSLSYCPSGDHGTSASCNLPWTHEMEIKVSTCLPTCLPLAPLLPPKVEKRYVYTLVFGIEGITAFQAAAFRPQFYLSSCLVTPSFLYLSLYIPDTLASKAPRRREQKYLSFFLSAFYNFSFKMFFILRSTAFMYSLVVT